MTTTDRLVRESVNAGARDVTRVVESIRKACDLGHMSPREALECLHRHQPKLFWSKRAREYFGGDA